MGTSKTILITGCGGPLGVNVTRSLRAAPEKLLLLGTEANRYHVPLALTDRTFLIPPARETEAYLERIRALVREEKIDFILPTHPVEVRTLSAHRNELGNARFYLPEHETILAAQNKWETYKLLSQSGLPLPRTHLIETAADLERCFSEITARPIWVRGAGVPGSGIGVGAEP